MILCGGNLQITLSIAAVYYNLQEYYFVDVIYARTKSLFIIPPQVYAAILSAAAVFVK